VAFFAFPHRKARECQEISIVPLPGRAGWGMLGSDPRTNLAGRPDLGRFRRKREDDAMPDPKKNESMNEYLHRCIPERREEHPDEDQKQSVAVCASMYRQTKKKAKAKSDKT